MDRNTPIHSTDGASTGRRGRRRLSLVPTVTQQTQLLAQAAITQHANRDGEETVRLDEGDGRPTATGDVPAEDIRQHR